MNQLASVVEDNEKERRRFGKDIRVLWEKFETSMLTSKGFLYNNL